MTFYRSLSSLISSASSQHARKLPLLRSFSSVLSCHAERNSKNGTTDIPRELLTSSTPDPSSFSKVSSSNDTPTRLSVPRRPSTIPWQVKAANMVQLTGSISVPPKSVTSTDGVFTAVSVLVQEDSRNPDLPDLWIPIIFQGTAAESAATHLQEKDVIYVTGYLTRAAEPAPPIKDVPESGLQLIVSDFKIVQEKTLDAPFTSKKGASQSLVTLWASHGTNQKPVVAKTSGTQSAKSRDTLWKDLVTNPDQWIDCRPLKQNGSVNPKSPDFKQKHSGQALWIDSAPQWASRKLNGLSHAVVRDSQNASSMSTSRNSAKFNGAGNKKLESSVLWNDLVTNPNQWVDYRMSKQNGSVKPLYPDFKNRESKQSLWLNTAPKSVLGKLNTLVFALPGGGIGRTKLTSTSWKNATGKTKSTSTSWRNATDKAYEKGSKPLGNLFGGKQERCNDKIANYGQRTKPDVTKNANKHQGAQKRQA